MNKKTGFWLILDLIFLIVFNVAFFVVGGIEHPSSVWISYGFIHFAYLMLLVTPMLIRKSSASPVFGFSLYAVSSVYYLMEFIVGLVFILSQIDSYKPALITQIVIAGVYIAFLAANLLANERTADSVERRESEAAFVKSCASRVKALVSAFEDKAVSKQLERAFNIINSSPVKTDLGVKMLEEETIGKIAELENAARAQDSSRATELAGDIVSLAQERNRRLRLL